MKILSLLVGEALSRHLGPGAGFHGEHLLRVSSIAKEQVHSIHTSMNHMSLAMEKIESLQ